MSRTQPVAASEPLDLVWAVSGRGMLLRAVVNAAEAGLLPLRVVGVVTDRPCPIEPFAAEHGIPVTRVEPPDADRSRFDASVAEAFRGSGARWAGLTFNRLIGQEPIDSMGGRILNVHFALLPLFPGFGPLRQAITSGMRVAGVTVHLVDRTMDGGTILGQAVCGVTPTDTEVSLGRRVFEAATPLVLQIARSLASARLTLDIDGAPVWSPEICLPPSSGGFPPLDADLVAFGRAFCATLD